MIREFERALLAPVDPFDLPRDILGTIPVVPQVPIRAVEFRPVVEQGSARTCGEMIASIDRILADPTTARAKARFYAGVRERDRADYQRRFGESAS